MSDKVVKSDEQWKEKLSPEEYRVCRQKGTERAFVGKYYLSEEDGIYRCICCENELFHSEDKFHSGSGWPSFSKPIHENSVRYEGDTSLGMHRLEVLCARCDSHLGHVFEDGPQMSTGKRY